MTTTPSASDNGGRSAVVAQVASRIMRLLPRRVVAAVWSLTRQRSGRLVRYARPAMLVRLGAHVGRDVSVAADTHLLHISGLALGSRVNIHEMCYIDAAGGITIGDQVMIAHGASILSASHRIDQPGKAFMDQGYTFSKTTIGNDVWIGAKATIVGGVTIGDHVVIGANSVVTRDLPAHVVAAGSPARVVRHLDPASSVSLRDESPSRGMRSPARE